MVLTLPCGVCSSRSHVDARKEPSSENLIPCASLPGGHGRPLPRDGLEQRCAPPLLLFLLVVFLFIVCPVAKMSSSDNCLHEVVGARFSPSPT